MHSKTIKSKNNDCGTAPGNLVLLDNKQTSKKSTIHVQTPIYLNTKVQNQWVTGLFKFIGLDSVCQFLFNCGHEFDLIRQ